MFFAALYLFLLGVVTELAVVTHGGLLALAGNRENQLSKFRRQVSARAKKQKKN